MEFKILNKDSFQVLGILNRLRMKEEKPETYERIWKDFESNLHQIRSYASDDLYYGIHFACGEAGAFDYLACMAVQDIQSVPERLFVRIIPAAQYAVFQCTVHQIGETYQFIFKHWLNDSGYEMNREAPVFEQYTSDEESPQVLIHIPIIKKKEFEMNEMISYCGLTCESCPAFIATLTNDDKKRAEIAKQWSKEYKSEIKPEDINCDGCTSISGRHINHCYVCQIRKCASAKKVVNCGHCADYACDKLDFIFNAAPDAKKRLDVIHNSQLI